MRTDRIKSYILVGVQLLCLILIALSGPLIAINPSLLLLEIAAGALGIWAIAAMRIGNVKITPDPRQDARLVRSGPYRFIRHPMYSALLLGALALVLNAPTLFRWALWIALAIDLLVKLRYEEQLLTAHFSEYGAYSKASKRLIPFIY